MHLLLLDNHDSFTWNLVELLRRTGKVKVNIIQPEQLDPDSLTQFDRIIFSPGPGLPQEQPAMFEILKRVEALHREGIKSIPVLGVCLGLQAIVVHFGGTLRNLSQVVHGQTRVLKIRQPDHPVFHGIKQDCAVGLYHSWAIDPATMPGCLCLLATDQTGTIMAVAHQSLPITGVQFHPESVMTLMGQRMVENWLV